MTSKITQLESQISQLQELLNMEKGKDDARKKLTDLAEKLGYTVEDLFQPEPAAEEPKQRRAYTRKPKDPNAAPKEPRERAAAKYRFGDQEWSGRGRKPRWFSDALAAGEDVSKFLISEPTA